MSSYPVSQHDGYMNTLSFSMIYAHTTA